MSNKNLKKEEMDKIIDMQKQDSQPKRENPLEQFRINAEINRTQLGLLMMQQDVLKQQLLNIEKIISIRSGVKQVEEPDLYNYLNEVMTSLIDTSNLKKNEENK